ncbi:hypothetical protein Tco_0904610 [Tanacetum coccineum]
MSVVCQKQVSSGELRVRRFLKPCVWYHSRFRVELLMCRHKDDASCLTEAIRLACKRSGLLDIYLKVRKDRHVIMLNWLLVESLGQRWLLEGSLVELEVVVVGDDGTVYEFVVARKVAIGTEVNKSLEFDFYHQQAFLYLEMEEVKVEFGYDLEVRMEIE